MRGEEIREFLIELESRFPDFYAVREYAGIINSVEADNIGKEVSFYEVVSLLNTLTGHSPSAGGNNGPGEGGGGDNEQVLQRVRELEDQVARKDRELQAFRDELVRTRLRDAAIVEKQSSDLSTTQVDTCSPWAFQTDST